MAAGANGSRGCSNLKITKHKQSFIRSSRQSTKKDQTSKPQKEKKITLVVDFLPMANLRTARFKAERERERGNKRLKLCHGFNSKKLRGIGDRRLTLRHQEEGIGHGRERRDQVLVSGGGNWP